MPDKPVTRRLFFALWPGDKTRQQISQQVIPSLQNLNGRKVSQHQWHITLAFLGSVTDEVMQCVIEQADKITLPPFEIVLDTVSHWSRPKVVWLGCSRPLNALTQLVEELNQHLSICGYTPEYKEFKTHMTLMRKVTRKPKPLHFNPLTWQVNAFVLVESKLDNMGSQYKVVQSWELK